MAMTKEGGELAWLSRWEDWKIRANTKHDSFYSYPSSQKDATGKITITCPIHGDFQQMPAKHLYGRGCPVCVGRGTDKLSMLKEKFPSWEFYDLNVQHSKTKFVLKCPVHGEFETLFNRLMNMKEGLSPCPKCNRARGGVKRRVNLVEWRRRIDEVHGSSLALAEFGEKSNTYSIFNCPEHGRFKAKLQDVVNSESGCPECGKRDRAEWIRDNKALTFDDFIERARRVHGDRYAYTRSSYTGMGSPVEIICNIHGAFMQNPRNHLWIEAGCPRCSGKMSKGEHEIGELLSQLGVEFERNNRSVLDGMEIDLWIPKHNLGIEYCGLYWHGSVFKGSNYHADKQMLAESKGVVLIQIFEDEWLNKPEIVRSIVCNKLGLSQRLFARKLKVVEIPWSQARSFFEENHIAGAGVAGSRNMALINDEGKLMMVLSVGPSRYESGTTEIYRMASSIGYTVVGGFSKLLANIDGPVVTYADLRYGSGNVYKRSGFTLESRTSPGYYWCKGLSRYSRQKFQKHKLVDVLPYFNDTLSERENCENNGYWQLFDAGHYKYRMAIR